MSGTVKVKVAEDTALVTSAVEVTGRADAYQEVPRGLLDAYNAHRGAAHEALQDLLEYLRGAPVIDPMGEYDR